MRDFNRFINSVLENPLLRSNELVEQFMTKNPDEFHIIKLKYKNLSKIVSMTDFHSLTGDLDITYYNDESRSSPEILKNIDKKRNILKDINYTMKNVINSMDNLNKYLDTLSSLFFDLEKEYQTKDKKFNEIYNLGKLFKNLSTFYFEKKNLYDFKIREFFKYLNLELKEIKNLCNDSKYAKINLEKCKNAINNFHYDKTTHKSKDAFNYELYKKQEDKNRATRTYNFLRNRVYEEFHRIMGLHYIRFKKYFSQVGAIIAELFKKEYSSSMQIINSF